MLVHQEQQEYGEDTGERTVILDSIQQYTAAWDTQALQSLLRPAPFLQDGCSDW